MLLEYLGMEKLVDPGDLVRLIFRTMFDLFFATLVIRGVYRRLYGRNEYVFTYFAFNIITFTLCFLLRKVPIELGFALGLFAVFGVLRYRTEAIGIRDLTYLFIVIGIAIVNAVANKKVSLAELALVNVVIVASTALLELPFFGGKEENQRITYDNIELVRGQDREALLADLRERTGLDVLRVTIRRLDLLRDTAELTIYYERKKP